MPTKDQNQKELMKPIGFDDKTEWVMVESEERKYIKRFEEDRTDKIPTIMRDKRGRLNSAEKEEFYKEAANIVSRLKKETQTFKDARYVIGEILKIEEKKENLPEKNIYEIFELFVLEDFEWQVWKENSAFHDLKSHISQIWTKNYENWKEFPRSINSLEDMKRKKYTTNFYFRCFISHLTGEEWIHIENSWNESGRGTRVVEVLVSEDLRLWEEIEGKWGNNSKTGIRSYEFKNEDKKREVLHFFDHKQIPLERIIKTLKKHQEKIENIIKFNVKYLVPIENSEKNNVPFNIQSILDEFPNWERPGRSYPFPHYIFQLRNPPRPICQKRHSGKCQMDGFTKMGSWLSDLPKELHIPVCGEATKEEVSVLHSYLGCIGSHGGMTFFCMKHPFLFLCCQNLLNIRFLILMDHPNNYEDGESIPGFDLNEKLHNIDVGVLKEYFRKSKPEEKGYALIKTLQRKPGFLEVKDMTNIRLIDYQGIQQQNGFCLEGGFEWTEKGDRERRVNRLHSCEFKPYWVSWVKR